MTGPHSRRKGRRGENELAAILAVLDARRVSEPDLTRTTEEAQAWALYRRIVREIAQLVDHADDRMMGTSTPDHRNDRPECPAGCRNARGGTVRQGNGHIYCPVCKTPFVTPAGVAS